jgi:hypothetical protein
MVEQRFIELCLAGRATVAEIDDYVARWHNGLAGQDCQLHEYLGMTWEEYARWVLDPDLIQEIIDARAGRSRGA